MFKPTKPTSTFKKVETKFNTKTSNYVIKVRKKRQDPDVSDQLQPHSYAVTKIIDSEDEAKLLIKNKPQKSLNMDEVKLNQPVGDLSGDTKLNDTSKMYGDLRLSKLLPCH